MKNGNHKIFFYLFIFIFFSNCLLAEPINGNLVSLQVLDKVTARISELSIRVGELKKYGSITIEIFECKKTPPEEIPEDFVLLQIIEKNKENNYEKIFQGWMLSSSPTLAPFEHPTYDIWVKDCKIEIHSE
tara:strand:- start:746 stop:1138 length:393 start_codon:yes stop_codon:yes gene_type:complete